jgi:hypothetical protein
MPSEDQPGINSDALDNSSGLSDTDTARSAGRADFMKRFSSVAVSVGFASKIGDFKFLSSLTIPTAEQLHQLILLVFAMVVVVGSWEFYFVSIRKRPLIDWQRFAADIVIVSLYIVLLLSVKDFDIFLFYLLLIMLAYITWDVLSMRAHPAQYGLPKFDLYNVASVYRNGVLNYTGKAVTTGIGPFITVWWFVVYALLFWFHLRYATKFYSVAVASVAAYIFYRMDQVNHWRLSRRALGSASIFLFLFLVKVIIW